MVLELHVWGPAFSLPSVDAQCLAAIAYFSHAVPRGDWELVASSDPSLSPTGELPAVRNENIWIGGFRNIVDYVTQLSSGEWSLDADLEGLEKADCIAFSSFVESRGRELLDLSLYVSTANYTSVTRPLYSKIQPFPLPYFTPPAIRATAKTRTEPLGLSSLDIDSSEDAQPPQEKSIIPESLRRPRQTVSSLLSATPENKARIRLDALACAFFEPLQALRGQKRFFTSHKPTTLDCLALGYLALALLPDLPSPWLSKCMRAKFPQLCAFVHDSQRAFFGGAVSLEDAGLGSASSAQEHNRQARAQGKGTLPWKAPDRGSLGAIALAFGSNVADALPFVSQLCQTKRLQQELEDSAEDEEELQAARQVAALKRRELYTTLGSIVATVGLFVGFMFRYGLIALADSNGADGPDDVVDGQPRGEAGNGALDQYGDAGAALAMLAQQMDFDIDVQALPLSPAEPVAVADEPVAQVEVDVVPEREHAVHV